MNRIGLACFFLLLGGLWAQSAGAWICPGLCTGANDQVCQRLFIAEGQCQSGGGSTFTYCWELDYCYFMVDAGLAASQEVSLASDSMASPASADEAKRRVCGPRMSHDSELESPEPGAVEVSQAVEIAART